MSFLRKLLGRKTDSADETALAHPPSEAETEAEQQGAEPIEAFGHTEPAQDVGEFSPEDDNPLDTRGPGVLVSSDLIDALNGPSNHNTTAVGLRVGCASDIGQLRDHNEDTLIAVQGIQLGDDAPDPFGFFVVTDGMGGHRAGEVASSLAARLVCREVLRRIYLQYLLDETPSPDMAPLTEILSDAAQKANDQVHREVPGGGTTLTCALILGRRAYIAHVGDSRAYLLTKHDIQRVTQDHSYVSRLIELGELTPEEAAVHPQRHVLYRAIGQGDDLDIDTYHQPLPPGSRLLLCSDGLSGVVSEEEIGRIVASAPTPQEACDRLLEAANEAGGPDNISALLIETPSD
jgi:serine/threonine protein phosphatase PrpC